VTQNWGRWKRTTRSFLAIDGQHETLALVRRVRRGVWRAKIMPFPWPAEAQSGFNRMEEACLWVEARLPLYELRDLL